MEKMILILILLSVILFLLWRRSVKLLKSTKFAKRSLSSLYGKTTEQFMPFISNFGYDPKNFRFIGTPVDGIVFDENEIIFMEFKSAKSRLTPKQSNIKNIIDKRRVRFEERRI
ncbi:MAG: Holliday junction resolvase-like protein [Berkelbacteria bacterium GW2011_GWA2_35_9]|uniref:Holliday junction resolvase-like protein n=1 Tax=Berkelbacteria bacterium GW2011_GWA2_35_9 TaxID=1618333 RepID=A0A0G0FP04_9BACT|nr:MAG: Holliday junction resolvase-like protein [Berkelbacteria bacterium GW2011_GWA2_35_9]